MRIVFFTSLDYQSTALFLYMYAKVAQHFHDVHVVSVRPQATKRQTFAAAVSRHVKKIKRLGWLKSLEILSSYPLQLFFTTRDADTVQKLLHKLPRPPVQLDSARIIYVRTVNGPDAIHVMRTLTPDVIIQAGAGILRPRLFKLARCGTLNVHHGIAPLIRGMDSIYWGLWEKRPEWLGATVHWIDEGIDTGTVLAYAPVAACGPGEAYPALFVRATQQGVACLVETLTRLAAGEKWAVPSAGAPGVYRSTISGWKLAALALRQTFQRSGRAKATDG